LFYRVCVGYRAPPCGLGAPNENEERKDDGYVDDNGDWRVACIGDEKTLDEGLENGDAA